MEDFSDKFRRNLVVLCTCIIVYSFLSPEFSDKGGLGFDLKNINLPRAWLCVGFILVYIFFRFFHGDEAISERGELKKKFYLNLKEIVLNNINRDLSIFVKSSKSKYFDADSIRDLMNVHGVFDEENSKEFLYFGVCELDSSVSHGLAGGDIKIPIYYKVKKGGGLSSHNKREKYKISLFKKMAIIFMGMARMHPFSKLFIDMIIPYVLFLISFAIVVVNCIKLFYCKIFIYFDLVQLFSTCQ